MPDKRPAIDQWAATRAEWLQLMDSGEIPDSLREIHHRLLTETDEVLVTSKHKNQVALLTLGRSIARFLKANKIAYLPSDMCIPDWIRKKAQYSLCVFITMLKFRRGLQIWCTQWPTLYIFTCREARSPYPLFPTECKLPFSSGSQCV